MKEIQGDIWELYDKGNWIVIPTNMSLSRFNYAIMGAGLALEAKKRKPNIVKVYGAHVSVNPRDIMCISVYRMFMVPTKEKPKDNSNCFVIDCSVKQLQEYSESWGRYEREHNIGITNIYLPRIGCGCGRLNWNDVRMIIKPILDDRFIVVSQ